MGNSPEPQRRRQKSSPLLKPDYRDEYLWKIPIIGDIGSGKTSIMKRLVNNIFSIKYKPTENVDFFLKQIEKDKNTCIRIQLWDVSGSEKHGNRTRMFYEHALGAIIVLDVSKQSAIKEASMWAADIHSKVTLGEKIKLPIIVLANKMDLLNPQKKKKVEDKLDVLARRQNLIGWWLCSAKDNYNIEHPFNILLNKILDYSDRSPLILKSKVIPRDNTEFDNIIDN